MPFTLQRKGKQKTHIIPHHLIVLHLPANGGHGTQPNPTQAVHRLDPLVKGFDLELMYRFNLQPIRDKDSERWTNWQRCETLYKVDF